MQLCDDVDGYVSFPPQTRARRLHHVLQAHEGSEDGLGLSEERKTLLENHETDNLIANPPFSKE